MMGVYAIRNVKNGKVYIGSSVNIEKRLKAHSKALSKGKHPNEHLQNAWNHYGEDSFEFFVLKSVDSKDSLRQKEQYYIDSYKAADSDYGYNLLNNTNIGLGVSASPEIRKKISIACAGERNGHYGKKHSEDVKQRISQLRKKQGQIKKQERKRQWVNEKHQCEVCGVWMKERYGSGRFCSRDCCNRYISFRNKQVIHDESWNKKVSVAKRGTSFSEEHRRRISENAKRRMSNPMNNPMYGKHHSEETKKHWSDIRRGVRNSCGFTGKHHSEETRKKISESLKKKRREQDDT